MRNFDFSKQYNSLLTPEIVSMLTQIHEFKGEQTLFIEAKADKLMQLLDIAIIESTESSNKIEGIATSTARIKKLALEKATPKTRDEKEIAGYRDVLKTIHESHDYIPPTPNQILQLHKTLYKYSAKAIGGVFKDSDNVITEKDENGHQFIRFQPVPAWETSEDMQKLYDTFAKAMQSKLYDPLVLISMFIFDFLCIHPFNDGNGRMSRLLTLLLLYRAGYIVGKYISIERLIESTKETYYEALAASSEGWNEEKNDYLPFVQYMLSIVLAAYREFSERVQLLTTGGLSKPERVREVIKNHLGKITKAEIVKECPDISTVTIQRALSDMMHKNEVLKISGGRYTAYVWNEEKDI